MGFWAKIMPVLLLATSAAAQRWLSARAGMINYAEGIFYLGQEQLQFPAARFREMAKGQSLRTGQGWVEVQLGPNAFLWMGEGGSLQMEDPTLTNVQLLVEQGSVLVEIYAFDQQTNKIRIHSGDAFIELAKEGLYRFDNGKSQLSVYRGKAKVQLAENKITVKPGKAVVITDGLAVSKFDTKQTDQLYANAAHRSQQILPLVIREARARQQQNRTAQMGIQTQQPDATLQRLQIEQLQREEETWRQLNNTRDPNSQEGHNQPPWTK
jgi:hypothetical protein